MCILKKNVQAMSLNLNYTLISSLVRKFDQNSLVFLDQYVLRFLAQQVITCITYKAQEVDNQGWKVWHRAQSLANT